MVTDTVPRQVPGIGPRAPRINKWTIKPVAWHRLPCGVWEAVPGTRDRLVANHPNAVA